MASKLTLLFATFALFFLLTKASIYQPAFDDLEDFDDNQQQRQRCQPEFLRHQGLRACQRFIGRQTSLGPRFEDELLDDEENQQPGSPILEMCCQQLRSVDSQCRCPVLRHAVRAQRQRAQGQLGEQKVRRMFEIASNIPRRCRLQPSVRCEFGPQRWD